MQERDTPTVTMLYCRLVANGMHASGAVFTKEQFNHEGNTAPTTAQFVVRSAYTLLADLTAAVMRIPGTHFVKAVPSPTLVNKGGGAEVHFNYATPISLRLRPRSD